MYSSLRCGEPQIPGLALPLRGTHRRLNHLDLVVVVVVQTKNHHQSRLQSDSVTNSMRSSHSPLFVVPFLFSFFFRFFFCDLLKPLVAFKKSALQKHVRAASYLTHSRTVYITRTWYACATKHTASWEHARTCCCCCSTGETGGASPTKTVSKEGDALSGVSPFFPAVFLDTTSCHTSSSTGCECEGNAK